MVWEARKDGRSRRVGWRRASRECQEEEEEDEDEDEDEDDDGDGSVAGSSESGRAGSR
jgi:hypothetical protein